jgi:WD40 repeat protein
VQVAFSPNNEVIATGGYDQAVKLWDTRSRAHQALQVARPFADSVTSVTITPECAPQAANYPNNYFGVYRTTYVRYLHNDISKRIRSCPHMGSTQLQPCEG